MRDKYGRYRSSTIGESHVADIDNQETLRAQMNFVSRLLDRPPSTKVLLILLLILWVVSAFFPNLQVLQVEFNDRMRAHYCNYNATQGDLAPPTPPNRKEK
jgi:hypothetical protein